VEQGLVNAVAWKLSGAALLFVLFVLLSGIRFAAFVLGPVGLQRLRESHPPISHYFHATYFRQISRVRVALQLAVQTSLVGVVLMVAWAAAGFPGWTRWLVPLAAGLLAAVAGGQVVARGLAAYRPESWLARLLILVRITDILLWPLSAPTTHLLRRLQHGMLEPEAERDEEDQEEEIEAFIEVGEQEGLLEEGERHLIRGVFDFGDRVVREVMTPRTNMVVVSHEATLGELRDLVVQEKHSRIPVYRETIDHIVGILLVRDLLAILGRMPDETPITSLVNPALFVPETKRIAELLRELQRRRSHLAIIVDEYGGTAGLVTIEDLVEEIVGEIQDEHESEEDSIVQQPDGALQVAGSADIELVAEALGAELEDEEFETVGGFILSVLGRVPRAGERFVHGGLEVEVLEADRRRIHRARIRRLPEAPAPDRDEDDGQEVT
jgi:CBS domain containing-hemolysin-like protein